MFVFGITLAALGALFGMAEVRERIHVDLAQQGDIFLMLYFGVFVSTIIVGPIIDSFGNKIVLIVSAILVVAGLLGFSVAGLATERPSNFQQPRNYLGFGAPN